jgi:uncharacterized protein (UPF0332 family)
VSLSADLIITARQLAQLHERRPRQSDLRRAISSAYYALFHGLAEATADRLVGATTIARQSTAWCRVYRALNHSEVKKACRGAGQMGGSNDLLVFASSFLGLQELRHQADYDPIARFTHSFVVDRVNEAEEALAALQRVSKFEQLDFITLALGMSRG